MSVNLYQIKMPLYVTNSHAKRWGHFSPTKRAYTEIVLGTIRLMYRYNTLIDFLNVLVRDLIKTTYLEVVENATCINIINKIESFTIVVITISYHILILEL